MDVKIRKVQDSNQSYTLWFEGDDYTSMELPRSRFKGMKPPKSGDILRILQQTIEGKIITYMTLNGKIIL